MRRVAYVKAWPFAHSVRASDADDDILYLVLWAAGPCVRVSVCVRLHYVHWWPDCDIIWTYLALFRCSSAVFRLSGLLAPGNSLLLLSAHYRDLMRRNHHQVHTSHTSLLCLASIFNIYIHTRHSSYQMCKIIGNSGIILRLIECDEDAAVAKHSS